MPATAATAITPLAEIPLGKYYQPLFIDIIMSAFN